MRISPQIKVWENLIGRTAHIYFAIVSIWLVIIIVLSSVSSAVPNRPLTYFCLAIHQFRTTAIKFIVIFMEYFGEHKRGHASEGTNTELYSRESTSVQPNHWHCEELPNLSQLQLSLFYRNDGTRSCVEKCRSAELTNHLRICFFTAINYKYWEYLLYM